MNTNSINDQNGCSTCQPGKENYTTFVAGGFRGTIYYQYDYRHTNGDLFSCVEKSLEECRNERDKWLSRTQPTNETFSGSTITRTIGQHSVIFDLDNRSLTTKKAGQVVQQIDLSNESFTLQQYFNHLKTLQ